MASLISLQGSGNSIIASHLRPPIAPQPLAQLSLNPTPSKPLCTYALPNTNNSKAYRRHSGGVSHRQSTNTQYKSHPEPSLQSQSNRKKSHSNEQKMNGDKLNDENESDPLRGVCADYGVFCALLDSCGDSKSLQVGKRVNEYLKRSPFRGDVELNNKLIGMYGRCGSMRDARRVFDRMSERNMCSWHLMINGYAVNGQGNYGLLLFEEMRKAGLQPNGKTFVLVLAACASVEVVEEGLMYFNLMKNEYGIVPGIEHYLGVIDVFGTSGHLNEAEENCIDKV
ncbi:pentatricopeptide repeat-containing protein [Quercus suber]|uniref:Pentatricopeptide repeat-containing protein n=1 Tax=Quercus suber TaxID=58331 RepID=A0AAW0L428_QUESU